MQVPLEISYKHFDKDDALDAVIRDRAARLERICDHIISCRVAVEMDHQSKHTGNPVRVRVEVRVPPGHTLAAKREAVEGLVHSDAHTMVREAFDRMERQLKKLMEKQEGQVKAHPEQETEAFVVRLFRDDGYGFIRTDTGEEYYFNKNSVLHGDFDKMDVGTGVNFYGEMGDDGPQASTVQIIDKARNPRNVEGKEGRIAGTGSSGNPQESRPGMPRGWDK